MDTTYRVHRIDTGMQVEGGQLEAMLNDLEGEVVAIVPNVMQFPFARINYLLVVERVPAHRRVDA